jgi:hypothetical protein
MSTVYGNVRDARNALLCRAQSQEPGIGSAEKKLRLRAPQSEAYSGWFDRDFIQEVLDDRKHETLVLNVGGTAHVGGCSTGANSASD